MNSKNEILKLIVNKTNELAINSYNVEDYNLNNWKATLNGFLLEIKDRDEQLFKTALDLVKQEQEKVIQMLNQKLEIVNAIVRGLK